MSQQDQPGESNPQEQRWDNQDLNGVSEVELSQMLAEAEGALRDIREELRARRVMAHAGIEIETPCQDLNEARGRWSHFFEFVRALSAKESESQSRWQRAHIPGNTSGASCQCARETGVCMPDVFAHEIWSRWAGRESATVDPLWLVSGREADGGRCHIAAS